MEDFLEITIKTIIITFLSIFVILGFIYGLTTVNYSFCKIFDKSQVNVFVDSKLVYSGNGYKVEQETITDNLQAPYFQVIIHGKNYLDIENKFIGKDIKVEQK